MNPNQEKIAKYVMDYLNQKYGGQGVLTEQQSKDILVSLCLVMKTVIGNANEDLIKLLTPFYMAVANYKTNEQSNHPLYRK